MERPRVDSFHGKLSRIFDIHSTHPSLYNFFHFLSPLFSESTRRARKRTWNRRRRVHTSSTMKMMSMTLMMTIFRQSILPLLDLELVRHIGGLTCGGHISTNIAVTINPGGRREGTAAILNELL